MHADLFNSFCEEVYVVTFFQSNTTRNWEIQLHVCGQLIGSTENAGPENGGPKKMKELKMQD